MTAYLPNGSLKANNVDVLQKLQKSNAWAGLDCKTVPIFAYSSTHDQSNERSGMRLKTENETGQRRYNSLA